MALASIIIPSYNHAAHLERSLAFLSVQLPSPSKDQNKGFEVIVVDDGSTDDTRDVVRTFEQRMDLAYVFRPRDERSGRARARNLGIQRSRGERLVFMDAGVVVVPSFVASVMARHREQPEAVFVHAFLGLYAHAGGHRFDALATVEPEDAESFFSQYADDPFWCDPRTAMFDLVDDDLSQLAAPWSLGWSALLSVPRELTVSVGGFDEEFLGWGAEDCDLCYGLHRRGAPFVAVRAPLAIHLPHETTEGPGREREYLINRRRLHRKAPSLASELFVVVGAMRDSLLYHRLERLSLEEAIPNYPAQLLAGVGAALRSREGPVVAVGLSRPTQAAHLGATHLLSPSERQTERFGAALEGVVVRASIGCETELSDGEAAAWVITDAIRLYPRPLQIGLLREAARVARRTVLLVSDDGASPSDRRQRRYREVGGWSWSSLDNLNEAAAEANLRLDVIETHGGVRVLEAAKHP